MLEPVKCVNCPRMVKLTRICGSCGADLCYKCGNKLEACVVCLRYLCNKCPFTRHACGKVCKSCKGKPCPVCG